MGVLGFVKSVFAEQQEQQLTDEEKALLHVDAHADGGLACNNKALWETQREAIMEWVKSMSKQLLTGNLNLINTPFPVKIFEPRSYLEKLADVWVYPRYLSEAAKTRDPLERMKFVITWFIAGLHHGFERWKKPFNPILGETWQATLSDGTQMFMEQISHHPPVSAFDMVGPGGAYKFVGLSQPHVSVLLKVYGFKTVAKGYRYVEFADGGRIDIHYPYYVIKGVVYSGCPRAETDGVARLVDMKNGLEAVIKFGSIKGSKSALLKRTDAVSGEVFYTQTPTARASQPGPPNKYTPADNDSDSDSDVFYDCESEADDADFDLASVEQQMEAAAVTITGKPRDAGGAGENFYNAGPSDQATNASRVASTSGTSGDGNGNGLIAARLEGSWLAYLDINGKRYWTLKSAKPDQWQPAPDPLPSDSRFRQDLACVARGDLKAAQEWKERLEHRQRADKKLRNIPSGHKA